MAQKKETPSRIADNKKAAFNYFFEERFEAGMVLQGWEVKALRAGKVQLTDGYVVIRNGELFLIGCQINPLNTASTPCRFRMPRISDSIVRVRGQLKRSMASGPDSHSYLSCSSASTTRIRSPVIRSP